MKNSKLLIFLLFMSTANFLSVFFIDKISFALSAIFFACICNKKNNGYINLLILYLFSILINIIYIEATLDVKVFFFYAIFSLLIISNNNYQLLINSLSIAILLNVILGIFLFLISVLTQSPIGVEPLWGKGMQNIWAAKGLGTTPQVYATLCSLLLLLLLDKKDKNNFWIKIIPILSIFLSLNRVWMIFLFMFFSLRNYKLMMFSLIVIVILLINFHEIIFFSGTIDSRFSMISMVLEFYNKQDFMGKLFGVPTFQGPYFTLDGTDFSYIESGPFFILIKFGLIGVIVYYLVCILWLIKFFNVSKILFFYSIYYLFFVQTATHEFLSISYWFFWIVSYGLFKIKSNQIKGVI